MNFPFHEPENVAVFTCVHVLENGADICYVTHDEDDGAWQFLCKETHDAEDARIVALKAVFEMDPTIGALAGMPEGCGAVRESKEHPWKGFQQQK